MAGIPKIRLRGLRSPNIPPAVLIGRTPGGKSGEAQLLNIQQLGKLGLVNNTTATGLASGVTSSAVSISNLAALTTNPPALDPSGKTTGTFNAADHNTSALAVTTTDPNDIIVLIVSAESGTATSPAISTVTNTGTAALTWNKQAALQWADPDNSNLAADLEVWWALAASAGTYNITVTFSAVVDAACMCGVGVNACATAAPWDTSGGTAGTGKFSVGNPTATSITTATVGTLVLAIDCGGVITPTAGAAPTGFTTLAQVSNAAGTYRSWLGIYYKVTTSGLNEATIATNDSHASGTWGMFVQTLTGVLTTTVLSTSLSQTSTSVSAISSAASAASSSVASLSTAVSTVISSSISTVASGITSVATSLSTTQSTLTKVSTSVAAILTAGGSVKVPVSHVAGLPAAATEGAGAVRAVDDALAPAIGAVIAGGGTVFCLVVSDGTNWKAS